MTEQEAKLVEAFAQLELGNARARAHQIANGSWVVIIEPVRRSDEQWYCWSSVDWRAYMAANPRKDPAPEVKAQAKKKRGRPRREDAYQRAITADEVFAVAM